MKMFRLSGIETQYYVAYVEAETEEDAWDLSGDDVGWERTYVNDDFQVTEVIETEEHPYD